MSRIVTASELLIMGKLCLDLLKVFLTHQRWDLSYGDPFLLRGLFVSASTSANWDECGVTPVGLNRTATAKVDRTRVDRIGQDASYGGLIPPPMPTWRANLKGHEAFGHPLQRLPLFQVLHKEVAHHSGFCWVDSHSCYLSWSCWVNAIAVGWPSPGQQAPGLILLVSSPSHAFGAQAAFILSDCSSDLEQELIMRILTHGLIHKRDLTSSL